jgi:hypothetical protein
MAKCKFCGTELSQSVMFLHEPWCEQEAVEINYDGMSATELKQILDSKEIEYKGNASKKDLISLLTEN